MVVLVAATASAQPAGRRLTTLEALRRFPGYFHLQNVLVRGELVESGPRIMLRSEETEMRVFLKDVQTKSGPVEVRGQMVDIGRLEPADPRAAPFAEGRENDHWPKPGEEIVLNVTSVSEAQPATSPSLRAIVLEPWKFQGQTVTITGNFRGRNLFGDLPDAPGKGRYDFVLRSAEAALWITGVRPRGRGFDLDVDRRMDTDRWLQITGMVTRDRGLVSIAASQLAAATPPEAVAVEEAGPPPPPPRPLEVVFNSPTEGETDVVGTSSVRVQFSRGLQEPSLQGHVRVTYFGAAAGTAPEIEFKTSYDAANRAIEIKFAKPLEPFRTVKVELLEGVKAFDGGPLPPWTLTFSVGG